MGAVSQCAPYALKGFKHHWVENLERSVGSEGGGSTTHEK